MRTALDTNVLFDLLAGEPNAAASARSALLAASAAGQLAICPVVYAELAAGFGDERELSAFLADTGIQLDAFSPAALWSAAESWKAYARRRGRHVQCPRCGHTFPLACPTCAEPIAWRQHIISDFLVGAHAATQADTLLTRDTGYYRAYFPALTLTVVG